MKTMKKESLLFNVLLLTICSFLVFATAGLGSYFTSVGIDSGWYDSLNLPLWTPAGSVIGMVWTILYILLVISVFILLRQVDKRSFFLIGGVFLLNLVLNAFWSYLFFTLNKLFIAFIGALFLTLSVFLLIYLVQPKNKLASILLYPYLIWVLFASYLNLQIWLLN
ncbi:MAG TPA: tryptophan-rich sensory protein [Candidatus Atribacteria bacterium]|nr:tryptophan-rich sensory protein [Candidatus Atribacteria bacterium]